MVYRRILLKLSGEALAGEQGHGFCPATLAAVAAEVDQLIRDDIQVALVIGAGNVFRGISPLGASMNRVTADYIGMLGTVMNALAFADALRACGREAIVQSAVEVPRICGYIQPAVAIRALASGTCVLFAGGTGNPFFSTDSTAALRGAEIEADVVVKATKVDGVYSADPVAHPDAEYYPRLTYTEVLERRLGVMDLTAITLCQENRLPLLVCSMREKGGIRAALAGETRYTLIECDNN